MNLSNIFKKTAVRAAIVLGTAGIAASAAAAQVYVRVGPPRPVYEHRPPARAGFVWHAGYHRWDGHRYVWVPGEYVAPPRPHAVWVQGHWVHTRHGWQWREGFWR